MNITNTVESDTAICSIQVNKPDSEEKIGVWEKDGPAKWSCVNPSVILEPFVPDLSCKVTVPPHVEPFNATVVVEANINLRDGRGPQPYRAETNLQFTKITPLARLVIITQTL